MIHLACTSCGGPVSAVAPLAELAADERRCPRCGAPLRDDRRAADRRFHMRRQAQLAVRGGDRRTVERRAIQRRVPVDPYRQNPLVANRIRWQTVQRVFDEDRLP